MRPQHLGCGRGSRASKELIYGGTPSMRPQHLGCGRGRSGSPGRSPPSAPFNEAAALGLRKRPERPRSRGEPWAFNEAAALGLRKRWQAGRALRPVALPSMRPQHLGCGRVTVPPRTHRRERPFNEAAALGLRKRPWSKKLASATRYAAGRERSASRARILGRHTSSLSFTMSNSQVIQYCSTCDRCRTKAVFRSARKRPAGLPPPYRIVSALYHDRAAFDGLKRAPQALYTQIDLLRRSNVDQ